MSTDRTKIEATLRQLQAELAESPDIDPAVKERLMAMQAEILSSLANPPPSTGDAVSTAAPAESEPAAAADEMEESEAGAESPDAEPASLTRRLTDAALYFEESHPSLSTAISNLAGVLGQMGF